MSRPAFVWLAAGRVVAVTLLLVAALLARWTW
jgi:hypothetical protein